MKNDNLLRSEKQNELEPLELESTIRSISVNVWKPTTEQIFEISRVNEFKLIEEKSSLKKETSNLKINESRVRNFSKIKDLNIKSDSNRSSKFNYI
jgi:hypothetical protein